MFDTAIEAARSAQGSVGMQWDKLCDKGRLDAASVALYKSRLTTVDSVAAMSKCDLVIEAVVERIDIKANLFAELEGAVTATTVMATNTSSLSVTALGARLKRPGQLAAFISSTRCP